MNKNKINSIISILLINSYFSNVVLASTLPNDDISENIVSSTENDTVTNINDKDSLLSYIKEDVNVDEDLNTKYLNDSTEKESKETLCGSSTDSNNIEDTSTNLISDSLHIEDNCENTDIDNTLSSAETITESNENYIDNTHTIVEDNWLNREVARQLNKNYTDLTDEDYLSIKEINMVNSNVTGVIPKEVGKLLNLTRFDLYNNNLSGEIPIEFFNLTKLTHISIARNNLTGSIPKEIGNLKNLKVLGLRSNNLTGSIPKEVGNLTDLTEFWVFDNNLTGEIPSEFANLKNLTQLHLYDNQFIKIGENFPEKFKTTAILNGNLLDEIPNQKKLVLTASNEIMLEVGDVLDISPILPNVAVEWNGVVEPLNSVYTIVPYIENNQFFDFSLKALNVGNTSLKVRIQEANSSNNTTISDSEFKVNILKKYVPLSLHYSLDKSEWTKDNVTITVQAVSSEDISYILLPNGNKVYGNTAKYTVSENNDYVFKAVNVLGEEKELTVSIKNIDNEPPVVDEDIVLSVEGNVIKIDLSKIQTLSGIFKIILPNGRIIENPTGNYIEYFSDEPGTLEFVIIDNAGNTSTILYDLSNNADNTTEDSNSTEENDNIQLPDTSGTRHVFSLLGLSSIFLGLFISFKEKDK